MRLRRLAITIPLEDLQDLADLYETDERADLSMRQLGFSPDTWVRSVTYECFSDCMVVTVLHVQLSKIPPGCRCVECDLFMAKKLHPFLFKGGQ